MSPKWIGFRNALPIRPSPQSRAAHRPTPSAASAPAANDPSAQRSARSGARRSSRNSGTAARKRAGASKAFQRSCPCQTSLRITAASGMHRAQPVSRTSRSAPSGVAGPDSARRTATPAPSERTPAAISSALALPCLSTVSTG